ncbi:MAG TPA: type II toxin-antitoxin system RelE/ParE family toxin [Myxococcota bacterium]|nr:type II toxin-antitoxin system RelE/ParE family toxin [Myxococcota bacterium]
MHAVRWRVRASADAEDAAYWTEQRKPGHGVEFIGELDALISRIAQRPMAFPEVLPRVRRAGMRRFPYGVYFVVRDADVDVLAVYHAQRRPRRFRAR